MYVLLGNVNAVDCTSVPKCLCFMVVCFVIPLVIPLNVFCDFVIPFFSLFLRFFYLISFVLNSVL